MISLKYGFLFVHIPKTAGNSIQNVLSAYSEDRIVCSGPIQDGVERFGVTSDRFNVEKHSTLQDYRAQLGEDIFQRLFKFTCIRNPWDRMISFYFSRHRGSADWDREEFRRLVRNVRSIMHYISLENTNNSDERHLENFNSFIRFENLNDDFKLVCEQIEIPFTPLSQCNVSRHLKYALYYDDELVELVRSIFLKEIKFFGYEFDRKA